MQKGFSKWTTPPVKQRKSGQVHRGQATPTEDFYLPIVDPDFLIIERDPDKLHAFARGLLNRLHKPSRSYSFHSALGDAEALGDELDLIRAHVALIQDGNPALGLAQVEEQLLVIGGGAHFYQRPRTQDEFLDGRLDPPHGVGGKSEAPLGLEAFDCLHQADMTFRDQVSDRQTVAAIAPGDFSGEPQMANDEPVSSVAITGLTPALGQLAFLLRVQHREPPDFLKIMIAAGFGRKDRPGDGAGHGQRPAISFETKLTR